MGLLYASYSRPLECDNVMGLSFSNADLSLRQLLGAKCRTKPQDHRHFKLLRGETPCHRPLKAYGNGFNPTHSWVTTLLTSVLLDLEKVTK